MMVPSSFKKTITVRAVIISDAVIVLLNEHRRHGGDEAEGMTEQ